MCELIGLIFIENGGFLKKKIGMELFCAYNLEFKIFYFRIELGALQSFMERSYLANLRFYEMNLVCV